MAKILIIEDDRAISDIERDYLELSGFETGVAYDGVDGLNKALSGGFDHAEFASVVISVCENGGRHRALPSRRLRQCNF